MPTEAERWYPKSPRAGARLKPIGLDFPAAMESGYAAKKKNAVEGHAQAARELKKVQTLTEHRLNTNSENFKKELDEHEAKAQKQYTQIGEQIRRADVKQKALSKNSQQDVAQFQQLTGTQESKESASLQQQRQAEEKVMQTSDAAFKRAVLTEQHLHGVLEVATQAVHTAQCDAKVKLEQMAQHRQKIREDCERHIDLCEKETQAFVRSCVEKGEADVLHSEIVRKKAAIACTCAEAKTSATQTLAKKIIRKDEEVGNAEVADAKLIVHNLQQHCDAAIKMETYCSAKTLQVAHDHCHFTEVDLAKAVDSYNSRMMSIKEDMEAYAKDVERNVKSLEEERIAKFQERHGQVKEAIKSYDEERLACNDKLQNIEDKLKEIHEQSKAEVDKMCVLWVEGSKACEEAVRELERGGCDAVAKMQATVEEQIKKCNKENAEIQRSGVASVKELEDTAKQIIETTQPNLEEKRRANDEAAAAATEQWTELRKEPDKIMAEADDFITAEMARANDEIQRLEAEAEAKIKECKAAAIAARKEEDALIYDTAAAWNRLRAGCFELRRLDLHDLARRVADGRYDTYA
eukprot:gnl/MRDRNA2_/MRDRNA2_92201_c0_seq1.p1 gnl/MRDRNA2_/MRDRNA2_92201_c0~~gnl/MRDRNA2_/MRDRNA2_92201_c0_seq1.p1  ORF type:complete len:578 (+),score=199.91 gnl/MRDRNA2_/MRDRNA2_92201_c0_seq1:62-1795(+)